MKISTFHKNLGNTVELIKGEGKPIKINYKDYDKGYASTIFTKHKDLVKDFPWYIGGTGIDINKQLPYNVEHLMPDYSLYPDNEYSIGFTTRGCIRNCEFCFVPKKEGLLKYNCDIDEFYNYKLKKIMLLDNNILAYNNYDKVFDQIRKINKPTCFKQGMDFRLLNDDKVEQLKSIKYDGNYIFAYDSIKIRSIIEKNMEKYRQNFSDWALKFFILVGFDSSLKEDIFRIMYLKNNKCLPYIMRFENCYISEYKDFYTDIASWVNQVFAFKKLTFEEFLYRRHTKTERIDYSLNLWNSNYISNL
jgi:hypothetical protein